MYSKVLVPLDGSEVSERALAHAQSLGDAFGAKVHLLQVISLSHEYEAYLGRGEEISEYSLDMAEQITANAQTSAEEYLKATAARLKENGIHVQTSVRQGLILENIRDYQDLLESHVSGAFP